MRHRAAFRAAPIAIRLLSALFRVIAACIPAAALAQNSPAELAIKATYLYKFPPFVEWPPGAIPPTGYFTICIVGDDPFGAMLDQAVSGQQIKDHPILIRRMLVFSPEAGCQIVYATGSAMQPVPVILAALRGRPVLSVTDGMQDGRAVGMFNFVIADNRVRFEIDDQAAAEAGLVISSKLLSLAVRVRPRS